MKLYLPLCCLPIVIDSCYYTSRRLASHRRVLRMITSNERSFQQFGKVTEVSNRKELLGKSTSLSHTDFTRERGWVLSRMKVTKQSIYVCRMIVH
jgi:hypothetical protein